jgi:NTE family protein
MKGLAHIGVLKVLARHGILPHFYVGTSVGSLVGALAAGGMMPEEMERIALAVRRRDILDYDWWGLMLRRGRNRSIYKGQALHQWVRRVLPEDRFDRLLRPLYVTAVDATDGREVVWGMPGLNEPPVHECVVASCSIPGIYPPKEIAGRWFVDGGMVDPLPVRVAVYLKATLVIAVNLDCEEYAVPTPEAGFADLVERGQTFLSRTITRFDLRYFKDAPLVVMEPPVEKHALFGFDRLEGLVRAGEEMAERVVAQNPLLRELSRPAEATPLPQNRAFEGNERATA